LKRNDLYILIAFLLAAVLYFGWLAYQIFPYQTADGSIYLEVAQNFAQNRSLTYISNGKVLPYVFWPPLYPILIAVISKLTGLSVMASAYLLSLVSLTFTLFLLYKIFKWFDLPPVLIAGGLFIFLSSWIFFLYFGTLSETLFLPLFLASFYYLLKWTQDKKPRHLLLTGLFTSLTLLTRYAGFGILGSYVLIAWIESNEFKNKLKNTFLLLFSSLLLFIPWYAYTLQYSKFFDRQWAFHPVGMKHFSQMNVTLANWLTPGLTKYLIIPVLVLLFISMVTLFKKLPDLILDPKIYLPVLVAGGYFVFILLSISFIDFDTPLDVRILSPVYVALIPAGLYYLNHLRTASPKLFALIFGLILFSHVLNIYPKSKELILHTRQIKELEHSEFIQTVKKYQNRIIWTNVTDLLKLYIDTDSLVMDFPDKFNRKTLETNLHYDQQMLDLKKTLDKHQGMIVYFFGFWEREFLPDLEDFDQYFGDYPTLRFKEGIIILPKNSDLTP